MKDYQKRIAVGIGAVVVPLTLVLGTYSLARYYVGQKNQERIVRYECLSQEDSNVNDFNDVNEIRDLVK